MLFLVHDSFFLAIGVENFKKLEQLFCFQLINVWFKKGKGKWKKCLRYFGQLEEKETKKQRWYIN